jgi:hypothetical protein
MCVLCYLVQANRTGDFHNILYERRGVNNLSGHFHWTSGHQQENIGQAGQSRATESFSWSKTIQPMDNHTAQAADPVPVTPLF